MVFFAINNIIYYFVEIATVLRTLVEKFLNFLKKDKRMKYLFVRQIDFVNARYIKIRNIS